MMAGEQNAARSKMITAKDPLGVERTLTALEWSDISRKDVHQIRRDNRPGGSVKSPEHIVGTDNPTKHLIERAKRARMIARRKVQDEAFNKFLSTRLV